MTLPAATTPLWRRLAAWIVLLAAPLVVFRPVLFGGYTFAQSPYAADMAVTYGATETVPVLDPGAASSQDESWLVLIQRSLLEGEIPLVNLKNGLGAPLLETLQPGVLYPLNLVLPLLARDSAWMFDVFVLLHVAILLAGLFVLLRLYARDEAALVVALAVGLSGATYQHLDMVHYRSFAWLPLGLWAAVRIARGEGGAREALVFLATRVAAIASGALQDAFVSSLAIGAVFLVELWNAPRAAVPRARRLGRFALLALASTLLAAPSVVPYLVARASGDLFTQATPDRSITGLDGDALLSLVLPHAHGLYPHLLRPDRSIRWMSNFAAVGAFLVVLGIVVAVLCRDGARRRLFLGLLSVTALAALKVQHVALLDFVQRVPLLNEVLFSKYHLFLFVLFGILAASGLEEFLMRAPGERRALAARAAVAFCLLLVAAGAYTASSAAWIPVSTLPEPTRTELLTAHAGSLGALLVAFAVLVRPGRHGLLVLALAVVAQAALVVPDGWLQRLPRYWTPAEIAPFVAQPVPERVLTVIPANQNLIQDFESISLFDPVQLDSTHGFFSRCFRVENAGFSLHPVAGDDGLNERELHAARLLGVTRIHGHRVNGQEGVRPVGNGVFVLEDSLPRVFLLSRAAFERIEGQSGRRALKDTLDDIRGEIAAGPRARLTRVGTSSVEFGVDRAFRGVAVVAQAYSRGWTLAGRPAMPFASILCAWDVDLAGGERTSIAYRPPGLRIALPLAVAGLVLAALATWTARRRVPPRREVSQAAVP